MSQDKYTEGYQKGYEDALYKIIKTIIDIAEGPLVEPVIVEDKSNG